ncbi:hypothetical protein CAUPRSCDRAFT_12942 [Caulochytrium protostelioides]|uniref:Uncharacterized protein n=1 Tax=Caulochytrium protostelioides TaxID=1555241 RepID=A0A4P9WQP1_9FUNG|nr:hypothetical protein CAUPRSCDRAFT_12942 [Caulochytrium protostelioides]
MRPCGRLINFDKYLKAGRIIQELQRFQVPYALQPVEALQAYLLDHLGTAVTSPQQLYSMSLAIEPRIPSGNENKLRSMAARARLLDTVHGGAPDAARLDAHGCVMTGIEMTTKTPELTGSLRDFFWTWYAMRMCLAGFGSG